MFMFMVTPRRENRISSRSFFIFHEKGMNVYHILSLNHHNEYKRIIDFYSLSLSVVISDN